jgi:hypothetical protein
LELGKNRLRHHVRSAACPGHSGVAAAFSVVYMKEPLRLDFLWAGLCLVAAAYFMFRGGGAVAS